MSFFVKETTTKDRYGEDRMVRHVLVHRIVITAIIAVFLLITLLCSFAVIPSGYTGVRTTFG